MGKVSRCPFCKGVLTLPEGAFEEPVVCPECREPIIPALLELELNPYAPPSFHPEASTADGAAMPTEPTSVFRKYYHAFNLLFSNLGLFSALILTVWLPADLLNNVLTSQVQDPANFFTTLRLTSFIEGLFGPIYAAGMIHALSKLAGGQKVTYFEAIAAGLRNWGRLLGTRFFSGMYVMGGMLLFLVPGIVLMVRYALIDPVVVLEGRSGGMARDRSTMLARGKAGQIVAAGVLYILLVFSVDFGIAFLLEALEPINNIWTSAILNCCIQIITSVITIVIFLIYWESACLAGAKELESSPVDVL